MDNNEDKSNEAERETLAEGEASEQSEGQQQPGADDSAAETAAPRDEDSGAWDRDGDSRSMTPEALEEIAEMAESAVRDILKHFPKIESPAISSRVEDNSIWVEIEGDPTGRLIGRRGQTIDAFQHIISKIVSHKLRKKITIHVDSEGYKRRRLEKLKKLAVQTADYVASTGDARALEPMSPADRRIVHITLKERSDIMTVSEGTNPDRFVVVWPDDEEAQE